MEVLKEIKTVCKQHGLRYHLDGARLWNAMVAKKDSPKDFGALFDTISLCFSKGLGTPLGTVLVGTHEAMKNAMRVRKVLGGGMRQVGYIAAACLYALDHHVDRLVDDHSRAQEIGNCLQDMDYIHHVEPTQTNIVIFYLKPHLSEKRFMEDLLARGIRLSSMGQGKLRIVTHLDYTQAQHQEFIKVLQEYRP